jgi:hypothetical protein
MWTQDLLNTKQDCFPLDHDVRFFYNLKQ